MERRWIPISPLLYFNNVLEKLSSIYRDDCTLYKALGVAERQWKGCTKVPYHLSLTPTWICTDGPSTAGFSCLNYGRVRSFPSKSREVADSPSSSSEVSLRAQAKDWTERPTVKGLVFFLLEN